MSENFYWRNGVKELDYTALNNLPAASLTCTLTNKKITTDSIQLQLLIKNHSNTVAFGNRIRLVNKKTKERVLPVIMNDNYITLMPGEEKLITMKWMQPW